MNLYPYTQQLLLLHACDNSVAGKPKLPEKLCRIISPTNPSYWRAGLVGHPDKAFVSFITEGLANGFRVGYDHTRSKLKSANTNLISAAQHPEIVSEYISQELAAGHLAELGPYHLAAQCGVQISPMGVIPKKGKPNKWRLIMDLSSPIGASANDGIVKDLCSFHYASITEAATRIMELGPGALMAKMDIKQAYRNIPVAPEDRHLLGLSWNGKVYIDQVLPFGLRSAPLIFSAIADALLYIMLQDGVTWAIHYIDDFLMIGGPRAPECQLNMQRMHRTCSEAGLPLEPEKTVGPSTILTFLGIEMDSEKGQFRLPQDKLSNIIDSLTQWRGKKACRKRELLSLIGTLAHASKVVQASRIFLHRLIDLSTSAKRLDHFIRLNNEARSDIEWWYKFMQDWNGVSILGAMVIQPPQFSITSDASGSWGCGAYMGSSWFQLEWAGALDKVHISVKELAPIVIAVALWGSEWKGRTTTVRSDNTAAVAAVNNNTSSHKDTAHMLRCLTFLIAK